MVEAARQHAFIVGAAKCGTSTLFELLGIHRQVCPCREKEPLFFTLPELYEKGIEWYEKLWDFDPRVHTLALEASVTYAEDPNRPCAAPLIKKHYPDARIMYIVRDPVKRIESHYNFIQVTGIDGADAPITSDFYINGSKYYHQFELYARHFNREQISVLDFRMLRDEQEKCLEDVLEFLELPQSSFLEEQHDYHAWGTENVFLRRKFLNLAGPLAVLLHAVPYGVRQRCKRVLGKYTAKRRTRLTDEQVDCVRQALKADRQRFLDEFGWYPEESRRRRREG